MLESKVTSSTIYIWSLRYCILNVIWVLSFSVIYVTLRVEFCSDALRMSEFFRVLASHADLNRLAIVDPTRSPHLPPTQYTYAQLLSRVHVFREHLIAVAHQSHGCLKGARVGLMVPPGIDFIVAVLSIWSVQAILGARKSRLGISKSS